MFPEAWRVLKETVLAFIEDEALTRGAAIAFYTVTSIAPILLIVIAIAGLAFGHDAAQNAITAQLGDLMGQETAQILQTAVASASSEPAGIMATIIGVVTLLVTASGVFGEMQTALNVIWKAKPKGTTTSRLIRARAASLGLVASLGFLLMVSLVVSTGLTAFGNYLDSLIPFGKIILTILNAIVSLALISFLFAAIYKVLPDRSLEWGDVVVGAVVTGILFTIGKSLISWYIGSSAVASSFGAAGGLSFCCCGYIIRRRYFCLARSLRKSTPRATVACKRRPLTGSLAKVVDCVILTAPNPRLLGADPRRPRVTAQSRPIAKPSNTPVGRRGAGPYTPETAAGSRHSVECA
jgi:membrane protein